MKREGKAGRTQGGRGERKKEASKREKKKSESDKNESGRARVPKNIFFCPRMTLALQPPITHRSHIGR